MNYNFFNKKQAPGPVSKNTFVQNPNLGAPITQNGGLQIQPNTQISVPNMNFTPLTNTPFTGIQPLNFGNNVSLGNTPMTIGATQPNNQVTASDTVTNNGTVTHNPLIDRNSQSINEPSFNLFGKTAQFDGNTYYLPNYNVNSNLSADQMKQLTQTTHETGMDMGDQARLYNIASQGIDANKAPDANGEEGQKGKYSIDLFGHTSYGLESALFGLGNALGRKDWSDNPDVARQEKFANTLSAIGNAGKLIVGGARVFTSGKGYGKKNSWVYNNAKEKMRDNLVHNQNGVTVHNQAGLNNAQIGTERTYEDGGEHTNTGGINISQLGYGYAERHNGPLFGRRARYEYIDTSGPAIKEALSELNTVDALEAKARADFEKRTGSRLGERRDVSQLSTDELQREWMRAQGIEPPPATTSPGYRADGSEGYGVYNYNTGQLFDSNSVGSNKQGKKKTSAKISNGKSKVKVNQPSTKIYEVDDVQFSDGNNSIDFKQISPNTVEINGKVYTASQEYHNPEKKAELERMGLSHKAGLLRNMRIGDNNSTNPTVSIYGKTFGNAKEAFAYLNDIEPGIERSDFASRLQSLGLNNIPEFAEGGEYGGQEELIAQLQQAVEAGEITPEQAEQYLAEMQGGGQQAPAQGGSQEDIVAQLQQAVDSGQMTPEEAQAYLEQMQQQGGQGQAPQGSQEDIVAQLQQAVQNGEMTSEEAEQYLAQMQQQGGGESAQSDVQQQPQMSPEEAKQQLEMMVQNGEISPEEAQTYLQQMFGATPTTEPTVPYTQDMAGKLTPEQYMTGEYTTGSENRPYNAEVEAGEYINKDGLTQKVVGNKHSRGGEKMNLEDGTIVISDKGRIGAANARALAIQTGMKLKGGDTFAQVLDIYTKRIGLDKLNKEQEDLFKQLKKVQGKGSQTTQDLNNDFLNMKIQETEEKKQQLLQMREQMVQVLFEMQENAKQPEVKQDGEVPKYALGSYVGGDPTKPEYGGGVPWGTETEIGRNIPITYGPGKTYQQIEADNNKIGSNRVKSPVGIGHWGRVYEDFNNYERQRGLNATDFSKSGALGYQKNIYNVANRQIDALFREGIVPLTNKHRSDYLKGTTDAKALYYGDLKDEANKAKFDKQGAILGGFADGIQGHRVFNVKKGKLSLKEYQEKANGRFDKLSDDQGNYFYLEYDKDGNPIRNEHGGITLYYPHDIDKPEPQPEPEPEPEPTPEPEPEKKPLQLPKQVGNRGPIMLPDQSVLPPEALRDAPKHDIRLNYLDRVQVSPEETMKQNYRAMNEARAKLEGLPDNMVAANLAQLVGNTTAANVQATQQANAQNAQSDIAIRTQNLNTLAQQQQLDYRLDDQYDERMNKAMDTTRKDLEGYFDFNRKVHVGDFNTRSQLNLLNNLYSKYGINSDGSIGFQPITNSPFTTSDGQAFTSQQKAIEHEMTLRNKKAQSQKKEETPKQEEVTPSKKK